MQSPLLQYLNWVLITLLAILIDRGRGYRDLIQFRQWQRTIKQARRLLIEWQEHASYLHGVGFTADFAPLQQAQLNVAYLQEYLRDLEAEP